MESCSAGCAPDAIVACRSCCTNGPRVDRQTVSALLTETALQRIRQTDYFFCASPDCATVYFDRDGQIFVTSDLRVPVWQKAPPGDRLLCYCFGENEREMRDEIARDGRSDAVDRVRAHIAAGRCACEIRNPRGACCLGDLMAAVKRMGKT